MISIYNIELFKDYNIEYNWCSIYYGLKKSLLELKAVSEYAIEYMSNHLDDDSPELVELAWEQTDKANILNLIERLAKNYNINLDTNEDEARKWRYCILRKIRNDCRSNVEILKKAEEIYARFEYPKDMIGFIRYMPVEDNYNPSKHTLKENENRLLKKLDEYLETETNHFNS